MLSNGNIGRQLQSANVEVYQSSNLESPTLSYSWSYQLLVICRLVLQDRELWINQAIYFLGKGRSSLCNETYLTTIFPFFSIIGADKVLQLPVQRSKKRKYCYIALILATCSPGFHDWKNWIKSLISELLFEKVIWIFGWKSELSRVRSGVEDEWGTLSHPSSLACAM